MWRAPSTAGSPLRCTALFQEIGARYITFLPLVAPHPDGTGQATGESVPAEVWGEFPCAVFDAWKARDIGRVEVQLFEETLRTAYGQEHSLCALRPTCGDVPVLEHDGRLYCCDHYVDGEHSPGSILETPLGDLLQRPMQRAFGQAKLDSLPRYCRACEVRSMCNGGCPKDRFAVAPDGEAGLSYLCAGYRRFFTHARPLVEQVAGLASGRDSAAPPAQGGARASGKVGRNQPCPCGSGRKYKHCCLIRS